MTPHWLSLRETDRDAYRSAIAFLTGRLDERATVDWALGLKPNDNIKRAALLDLIDNLDRNKIGEPWRSAWRLIEESWDSPDIERDASLRVVYVAQRLKSGDRTGSLIAEIAKLVSAKLKVKSFSTWEIESRKLPKHPRSVRQLFSVKLDSHHPVNPGEMGLYPIQDVPFLTELANALDSAVVAGLDIARRIGWDGEKDLWLLGQLNRVYYVQKENRPDGEREPDEFHRGLTPSVKLLYFVVSRLIELETETALGFALRWKRFRTPIHMRLWAALSRDKRITSANEVASFLLSLDDRHFWNQNTFPEIAELRARRFLEFPLADQKAMASRLQKRPPRTQWPKKVDPERVETGRLYWAIRELRRIEVAGASLPKAAQRWMAARIGQFPDLTNMSRVDEGFMGTSEAQWVGRNPDAKYDLLVGEERLKALEIALSSDRGGWNDDPSERAASWIRQKESWIRLIDDFESLSNHGAAFPRVWNGFGWAHSPATEKGAEAEPRDIPREVKRVLTLLVELPAQTAHEAIEGISQWLSTWEKYVIALPLGLAVWLKLWPIAVEATNANKPVEEDIDLNTLVRSSDDHEPMDLDTLNSPVGKFVGIFLAACPSVKVGDRPFQENNIQTQMRNAIESSIGPSGLIVKYRLVESLYYFLNADQVWTERHLIAPLLLDDSDALVLWRAVARKTRFVPELKFIGSAMVNRATDLRLGRESRRSLVFSLVVECLHSFREQRVPAVPYADVQQMIRLLDDEVRAYGAGAVQRFIRDGSAVGDSNVKPPSAQELFRSAAKPFLHRVWPQEQSLSTPGVSSALADLPATAQDAFAEAVGSIDRFLVPFECWSMADYGLYGDEDGEPKLSNINNQEKAAAFLRLLDRTIGVSENSVIPMDLGNALDQVRKVAPNLVESQVFRRLATAARRT